MFAPKKWIGKFVALLSLAAGATVAPADESAKGYEERPTYVRFTMNLGDRAREVRKAPWTEDEVEGRDDFAARYNPAPFYSTKAPTLDTGGLFQTEAPTITVPGFTGVSATAFVPPDPSMAAGPSDLAIAVNSTLNVRNYAGVLLSSQNIATLLGTAQFISDPNIEYDSYSGRFIGTVIALDNTTTFTGAKWWIFYSDNNTALGGWTAFSVNARLNGATDANIWADYPHIGLTNDAVCLGAIMFATPAGSGDSFGKLRFMDKADVYDGGGIAWLDFWNLASDGTPDKRPVPATSWDSPTRFYVVTAKESGSSKITVREFDDTAGGNNGAQTTLLGTYLVDVASYATPPDCRQPGGTTPLDNIDCRILQAEVAAGDLFAVHTTAVADGAGNASAVKAYKLDVIPNQAPTVLVDSQLFAGGLDYCYPGITGTSEGAAVITFGRSGASENPSMRVSGFKFGATSIESSATVKSGVGTYSRLSNGRNRWGDYFCCARSPVDLRTVWMHGEYAEAANNWGTWVAASKFDAYHVVVPADISIQTAGTGSLTAHVTNSDTFANVAGSTVSFYVNSVFVASDVTDASGNASVPYTVAAGSAPSTRTILAIANATASLDSNSGTSTLTVTKANTAIQVASEVGVPGETVSLLAQLKRLSDNQLLAGQNIAFTVNGNFAGSAVTDASGLATIPYTIVNGFGSYPI
ncbi:MAG: hypothetical protein K8R88_04355, partial [Armatimonadetes bacterium]|nr:hypothetical protein [Armatimonadota bacterium]